MLLSDGSDEDQCHVVCSDTERSCEDGRQCLDKDVWCDRVVDCWDASDEGVGCDMFTCSNSETIDTIRRCDLHYDCTDGSDEQGCEEFCDETGGFLCDRSSQCLPLSKSSKRCNGYKDCLLYGDELNCPRRLHECNATMFTCHSRRECVPYKDQCDGVPDCSDGSDESNCICTGLFQKKKPVCPEVLYTSDNESTCCDHLISCFVEDIAGGRSTELCITKKDMCGGLAACFSNYDPEDQVGCFCCVCTCCYVCR